MKNTTRIWGIAGRDAAVSRQTPQGFVGVLHRQNSQLKKSAWMLIFLAIGFAACGSPTGGGGTVDVIVDIAAIPGVTAPATGVAPVTTITPTEQYTGTVAWNPVVSGAFAASTVYTATITLTAKNGFTLQGVGANFFTVTGATATNAANLGTVTAVFPQTGAVPATPVNIPAIPGVTTPVTGATPVTTITPTEQYTGTVTWAPTVSGAFAASTDYTATITLTAKAGFTLQGVGANFFTVTGATASNAANLGIVTAVFPQTGAVPATPINIPAIPGVTAPVTGGIPVTAITPTEQYTGAVTWAPAVSGAFAASTVYTATITLTAKAGFTLQGVTTNFFTVAGTATPATNTVNSGTVTAVFPQTGAVPADPVNIPAIEGVTAPVTGVAPVTAITPTEQYTGAVTWDPSVSGAFAASTDYTATITLTAKAGYTLHGVADNFFTVADATPVSYDANLGVITATFPQTAATITTAAITGVTPPVVGATPATLITETPQYTGTVTWDGSPATFAEGTAYTANITLTAKAGYTLHGVAANFFTVAGTATPATNAVNSGVIAAKFPATAILVTGVTMSQSTLDLVVNDVDRKTSTLSAAVAPSTATNQNVTWESDNTDVATVNSSTGLVTAVAAGTATITVTTAEGGFEDYCTVTVKQPEAFVFVLDMADAAPTITGPVISISGADDQPKTATLSVQNPELYSGIQWRITGTGIIVRGNSITLNSANIAYNSIGEHFVTVEVVKDGVPFNKTVTFTVTE